MRRHGRSVHRKRIEKVTGQPDALGLALPGLACGLLAIMVVLAAGTLRREPRLAPLVPIASVGSGSVAPLVSGALANPDSSSLAALSSAQRSDRP